MQAKAKKVYTYIRTKTWITPHAANSKAQAKASESQLDAEFDPENPSAAPSAKGARNTLYNPSTVNPKYTEEEKQKFRDDPAFHKE